MSEDKQLERIYDYTKWHIGIYLSAAGVLTTALGYLAQNSKVPPPLDVHPELLLAAIAFMFLAGICGAIVASSCTEATSYQALWDTPQGPYHFKFLPGRVWARLEHSFFWLSVCLASASILATTTLRNFMGW